MGIGVSVPTSWEREGKTSVCEDVVSSTWGEYDMRGMETKIGQDPVLPVRTAAVG